MELEKEINALGSKMLALEKMITTVAARKEASTDTSVIDELSKKLEAKAAELDSLKAEFGKLIEHVTKHVPIKEEMKHEHLWNFWPFN